MTDTEPNPKEPLRDDPSGVDPNLPRAMSQNLRAVGVTALVLTVVVLLIEGVNWAVGTAIGGALAFANLWVFARVAAGFLSAKGQSAPWAVVGAIKMLGLLFCVYLILRRGDIAPLAFVIGYGALPIGIVFGSFSRSKAG